jgi:hypothetical protein
LFAVLLLLLLVQAAGLPAGSGPEVLLSWLAGVAVDIFTAISL